MSPDPSSVRILLVEDNPGDARLLREFLSEDRRLASELVHKASLKDAAFALAESSFDVVLLDLSLPDAQGLETLIKLREGAPRVPILVLTGLDDEDTALQAVQRGAQDYLVKDQVDASVLGRAIRYAIERRKADAMERQLLSEQTARAQAEVGEQRFRGLAEAIPQIVWQLSPDGEFEYLSPRFFSYTGHDARKAVNFNDSIHPADAMQVVESWGSAKGTGSIWQLEYRLRRKDEVYRWHLARTVPVIDIEGRVLKWYGTATDIDDQKRVEEERGRLYEQARAAIKSRDDLLATVSHDLRSPLSSILMSASLLAPEDPKVPVDPTSKTPKYAGMISRAAKRMDHLIRDLLDIASIESGHLSINPARVAVSQLLSDAFDAMQATVAEKKQRLETNSSEADAFVHCDKNRILQVLTNIIGNASKFSPAASAIVLATVRHGDEIEFSITDRGPGIVADQLRHVFERFWQAKETAKAGTGLGLAICRGIMEQHRGKIWVESTMGVGTAFTFSLPVGDKF